MSVKKILPIVLILIGVIGLWLSTRSARDAELPALIGSHEGSSVVIVTIDTTRADRFGCYGSNAGLTPNIDAIAQEGIVFERAQAVAPVTLPSHTSIMTGLYPITHGVRNNGMFVLDDSFETLAEVFSQEGYATGAFISAQVLIEQYGLGQGFDVYNDDLREGRKVGHSVVPSRRGDLTLNRALEWLDTVDEGRPFFMWLHLYDPHAPYDPPPEYRSKFPADPYGGEIAFADSLVGNLLGELQQRGLDDSTVLTVLADHGESLGEHGERTHGFLVNQPTIHVPWILRVPGGGPASRFRQPVSQVDVAPLIAQMVGVETPNAETSDGIIPQAAASAEGAERSVYYEAMLPMYQYGWAALRGLRSQNWVLMSGNRDEVFDLDADARELTDLAQTEVLQRDHLREKLDAFVANDTTLDREAAIEISPSEKEALQALGYLATTAPPRTDPPDPRDLVANHAHIERSRTLIAAGLYDEAFEGIDRMLESDPYNIAALNLKGSLLIRVGDYDGAEETFRRSLEIDPANSEVFNGLCRLEIARGNHEKVIEVARAGKRSRSPFGSFDAYEATALKALGRSDEAAAVIEAAIRERPDDPDLLAVRARDLVAAGQRDEAEAVLRRAVEVSPFHQTARSQLGSLLEADGRPDEAVEVFEELLRIQPDDAGALFSVGSIRLDADPERALPYLEEACRLSPGRQDYLRALGAAYIRVGRLNEAEGTLRRAVEVDPSDPRSRNNLGIVLTQMRQFDRAIEEYRAIVDQNPGFLEARNNLAIALAESGDLAAAEQMVRDALSRRADYLDAHLTLAAILDRDGRIEEEYKVLETAHGLAPERDDVALRLAMAAGMTDRCDRMIEVLGDGVDDPEGLAWDLNLEVAQCLEAAEQFRLARRHYEEAGRKSWDQEVQSAARAGVVRMSRALGGAS
jgi:choline-sulfatase